MLTEILLDKFECHMPYYRQIKKFFHQGLEGLTESTVDGWFRKTAELLTPLYVALEKEIFSSDYVQADETVVPVVDGERHKAEIQNFYVFEDECDEQHIGYDESRAAYRDDYSENDDLPGLHSHRLHLWLESEIQDNLLYE